jgi:hypothetical protein
MARYEQRISDEAIKRARDRHVAGESLRAIADSLGPDGPSPATLSRRIRQLPQEAPAFAPTDTKKARKEKPKHTRKSHRQQAARAPEHAREQRLDDPYATDMPVVVTRSDYSTGSTRGTRFSISGPPGAKMHFGWGKRRRVDSLSEVDTRVRLQSPTGDRIFLLDPDEDQDRIQHYVSRGWRRS